MSLNKSKRYLQIRSFTYVGVFYQINHFCNFQAFLLLKIILRATAMKDKDISHCKSFTDDRKFNDAPTVMLN